MSDNYIFLSPSYLSGAARLLDFGATYDSGSYWMSATPAEADARAARIDAAAVDSDHATAAKILEQEQEPAQEQAA